MAALLGTAFVGLLTFLTSIFGNQIYQWLVAASGLTALLHGLELQFHITGSGGHMLLKDAMSMI